MFGKWNQYTIYSTQLSSQRGTTHQQQTHQQQININKINNSHQQLDNGISSNNNNSTNGGNTKIDNDNNDSYEWGDLRQWGVEQAQTTPDASFGH